MHPTLLNGEPVTPYVLPVLPALGDYPPLRGPGRVFEFFETRSTVTELGQRALQGTRYVLYNNGTFALQQRANAEISYNLRGELVGLPARESTGTYVEAGTTIKLEWSPADGSAVASIIGERLTVEPDAIADVQGTAPAATYVRVPHP
jgi:hypothetical protein